MDKNRDFNYKENVRFTLDKNSPILYYFRNHFGNMFGIDDTGDTAIISTTNIIGVVKAGNDTYRFFSKVDDVLTIFNMMEKISLSEYQFKVNRSFLSFDPKQKITIAEGTSLILQLVDILINELLKLRNIGYTKTYNSITENIVYLRGKLDINKQIKKNIIPKKFYCNYNQMDFVTPENLIIYKTINKIINTLKISNEQRQSLVMFRNEMNNILGDINSNILQRDYTFNKTRVNKHYEYIINICEMFLEYNFYSSIKDGENIFCNFLINIDVVFERYIFLLIKELVDETYVNYEVEEQVNLNVFRKLASTEEKDNSRGFLMMKPDIVIYEKKDRIPIVVIDTKYVDMGGKKKLRNSSYYQIISYMLGLYIKNKQQREVTGILLAHGEKGNSYRINYSEEKHMNIYTETINILSNEMELKTQLRNMLDGVLLNV